MAEGAAGPLDAAPRVAELRVADTAALHRAVDEATEPFVVRGLVADWPLVAAARRSAANARAYLLERSRDRAFAVSIGRTGDDGRLFYDDTMGMNFQTSRAKLPDIFGLFDKAERHPSPPPIYLASIDVGDHFDGLHEANHVDLGERRATASIWIGTRTRIAAHNDSPNNLACVAAGRRRFTLFPRAQFKNLHLGPLDNTPAGRAVSMVDFHAPDLARHPRFAEAAAHARVAELEAGDALYIPALWWHHVEGLAPFNILLNYWWRDTPRWLGQPQDALNHALLAIRDLPADERAHWRDMFDHYVWGDQEAVSGHIPPAARGVLAPLTPETAGQLRAFLLRQLSR